MPATTTAMNSGAQSFPDPPAPSDGQKQRAFLALDAVLTSSRRARAWTREVLGEWRLNGLADDGEAVVAELVANAVVHACAGPGLPVIGLELAVGGGELAILVSDGDVVLPEARCPAAGDVSGRGLLMVEALSGRYGWHRLEGGAGKVVWAVLEAPVTSPPPCARLDAPARPVTVPGPSGLATAEAISRDKADRVVSAPGPLALSAAGVTAGAR